MGWANVILSVGNLGGNHMLLYWLSYLFGFYFFYALIIFPIIYMKNHVFFFVNQTCYHPALVHSMWLGPYWPLYYVKFLVLLSVIKAYSTVIGVTSSYCGLVSSS